MRGYPRSMHQNYRISEYGSRQETQTLSTQPAVSSTRMPTPTRVNVSSSGYEVGTVNAAAVTTTCVTGSTWAHSLIRRNHCLRQHKFPAHYECECEDHRCQDASHRESLTEEAGNWNSLRRPRPKPQAQQPPPPISAARPAVDQYQPSKRAPGPPGRGAWRVIGD